MEKEKLVFFSMLATGAIIIAYILEQIAKRPPFEGPKSPGQGITLVAVYPEPGKAYFHAWVRQAIEVGVVNNTDTSMKIMLKGRVTWNSNEQELPPQTITIKPYASTSVTWGIDFPFVPPWSKIPMHVYIDAYSVTGVKIGSIDWVFYVKGTPW